MERQMEFIIKKEEEGSTVKSVLQHRLNLSRRLLTNLKQTPSGILVNGKAVFVNHVLKESDHLRILLETKEKASETILPVKGPLDIFFEDEDILIVNKPGNMPVHPSFGHYEDSLANIVMWYYKEQNQSFVYRPVNRLDSGTSGLMMIAKNAYTHHKMGQAIENGSFKRSYLGIVNGHMEPKEGTICYPIGRKEGTPLLREVKQDGAGKPAITHYRVLEENKDHSLLKLHLDTGRTHQIRVHLSFLGHPLVNDFLYGKEEKDIISRHALHSHTLTFIHPFSGKKHAFEAKLPLDMEKLLMGKTDEIFP